MRHIHEKGKIMNRTERSTKTPPRRTGAIATLGAFRGLQGSGASPSAVVGLIVAGVVAVVLALLAGAAPALAAGPPQFRHEIERDGAQEVFATRVHMGAGLETGGSEGEVGNGKW